MRGRNLRRTLVAAGLVAASAVLVLVLAVAGLLAFIVTSAGAGSSWNASMDELSAALVRTEGGYAFTGGEYLAEKELWAMLVDEGGAVVWQQGKPADVPDRYSLTDVAAFTRWYLSDYPVQVRVREDGLLVAGGPKEHLEAPLRLGYGCAEDHPFLVRGAVSAGPAGVLGLTALVLGRQFRREQQERDFARSDWINGISHDIRTPLSMVMGYAGQLEADPVLPPRRRAQAAIIRRQSQTIRDLINDLNLTMRLDYAMQPLRWGSLHPAALVRQVAADVLNGGLEERYALAVEVPPEAEALTLEGDASLLRRALLNLVNNCVRHNPEGCAITLTAAAEGSMHPEGGGRRGRRPAGRPGGGGLAPDGGAAHGTGLRLVEQIARAHGGALELHRAARGVLAVLRLPL
ncbi:MAG: sensor histidine kinase [Flavonifractor plautii]